MISAQEQKFNRINFRDRIGHIDNTNQAISPLANKREFQRATEKDRFFKGRVGVGKKKLLAKKPLVEARSPFQRASRIFPSVDQEIATLTG